MLRIITKHIRNKPSAAHNRKNSTDAKHRTTENKNGAAPFRYCAVFCYLNSHLYGADGETRTLTPCGAGT